MILGQKDLWQTTEVKHLLGLLKPLKNSPRQAYEVMIELMQEHNLTHIYRNVGGPNEKPPVENLQDIVAMAAKRGTPDQFMDWLRKLTYACEAAKAPDYEFRDRNPILALSTVHQAKGKEWKHVFVVGVKQGLMPHKDGEWLEEKRIFFVGCSRAADTLNISYYGPRSEFLEGL
jgi:DNA helicase-2/ATP-dependent DNA helicase PcrA